jgi:spermidine/putrescine transport system permease protein
MKRRPNLSAKLLLILAILLYLFQWAPVFVLMTFSFNDSKYGVAWEGFTIKWYEKLFQDKLTWHAFKVSLIVAIVTMAASVVMGTMTAYALYKFRFRGKEAFRSILILPLIMPEVVVGIAMLVFCTKLLHIPLGYASIIITHIAFSIPLVTFIVLARMQRIDWTLEEAAMDLGANRFTTLRKITIPLLMPAILASLFMTFPWSFNDFVITFFVAGVGTTTLPIRIYSMIRIGVSPLINALGTLVITGSLLVVVIAVLVQRGRGAERLEEFVETAG